MAGVIAHVSHNSPGEEVTYLLTEGTSLSLALCRLRVYLPLGWSEARFLCLRGSTHPLNFFFKNFIIDQGGGGGFTVCSWLFCLSSAPNDLMFTSNFKFLSSFNNLGVNVAALEWTGRRLESQWSIFANTGVEQSTVWALRARTLEGKGSVWHVFWISLDWMDIRTSRSTLGLPNWHLSGHLFSTGRWE